MFGFGCIEPFSGLSKTGMAALGIFIGTIFAWLTISVDWPGCISMVAIIVFGVATYTQVFQWSLGSWVSTLCIFFTIYYFSVPYAQNIFKCNICRRHITFYRF